MEVAIKPKPPTDADYKQLQLECRAIAQPFLELIGDIYNRSTFSLVYSPAHPEIRPQITYFHEYDVEAVQIRMKAAIDSHVRKWAERFGTELPNP